MKSLLAPLAAFLFAPAAVAAPAPDVRFHVDLCGPSFHVGTPRFGLVFGGHRHPCAPPVHYHGWRTVAEREWVAPCYERRVVSWDCHRRPVYQTVMVRPGYWTMVHYQVCGCGERRRC
jgi:hypothetical protein